MHGVLGVCIGEGSFPNNANRKGMLKVTLLVIGKVEGDRCNGYSGVVSSSW